MDRGLTCPIMTSSRLHRTIGFVVAFMAIRTCCLIPVRPIRALRSSSSTPRLVCSARARRREDDETGHRLPRLESPVDDDRLALRTSTSLHPDKVYYGDWGVERYDRPEPRFPDTLESLTDAAWEAVAGTLYGKQRLDPNQASNAMSSSIFGYRPVRGERDLGRIGLEIDGAQFLFPGASRGTAIRRVALELAAKLSQGPWEGFEEEDGGPSSRPVAIYFNTIKQSLTASQELLWLKRVALEETGSSSRYENITILCLHQDGEIPKHMRQKTRGYGGLGKGIVDPTKGIILIVQPTDYNREFPPPGPSIGAVSSLQQLVARAAVQQLPAVIISPRFLALDHHGGWDQSGYQRSATYGGDEPPKGPTPWVMRDFTPPVFAWVGCALSLSPHESAWFDDEDETHDVHHVGDDSDHSYLCHHSRVALTQSVMQEGHAWHIFAARECETKGHSRDDTKEVSYQYLASTKTSSGRPPRDIIRHVFDEWS